MANLVEYVKTAWENGKTALNAARMNNMEQGISNCATQINRLGDSVSQLVKSKTCTYTTTRNGNFSLDLPHGTVFLYAETDTQIDGNYLVCSPYYYAPAGIGLSIVDETPAHNKVCNAEVTVTAYYISPQR